MSAVIEESPAITKPNPRDPPTDVPANNTLTPPDPAQDRGEADGSDFTPSPGLGDAPKESADVTPPDTTWRGPGPKPAWIGSETGSGSPRPPIRIIPAESTDRRPADKGVDTSKTLLQRAIAAPKTLLPTVDECSYPAERAFRLQAGSDRRMAWGMQAVPDDTMVVDFTRPRLVVKSRKHPGGRGRGRGQRRAFSETQSEGIRTPQTEEMSGSNTLPSLPAALREQTGVVKTNRKARSISDLGLQRADSLDSKRRRVPPPVPKRRSLKATLSTDRSQTEMLPGTSRPQIQLGTDLRQTPNTSASSQEAVPDLRQTTGTSACSQEAIFPASEQLSECDQVGELLTSSTEQLKGQCQDDDFLRRMVRDKQRYLPRETGTGGAESVSESSSQSASTVLENKAVGNRPRATAVIENKPRATAVIENKATTILENKPGQQSKAMEGSHSSTDHAHSEPNKAHKDISKAHAETPQTHGDFPLAHVDDPQLAHAFKQAQEEQRARTQPPKPPETTPAKRAEPETADAVPEVAKGASSRPASRASGEFDDMCVDVRKLIERQLLRAERTENALLLAPPSGWQMNDGGKNGNKAPSDPKRNSLPPVPPVRHVPQYRPLKPPSTPPGGGREGAGNRTTSGGKSPVAQIRILPAISEPTGSPLGGGRRAVSVDTSERRLKVPPSPPLRSALRSPPSSLRIKPSGRSRKKYVSFEDVRAHLGDEEEEDWMGGGGNTAHVCPSPQLTPKAPSMGGNKAKTDSQPATSATPEVAGGVVPDAISETTKPAMLQDPGIFLSNSCTMHTV